MREPLWITGMFGLGDNIFQRSILREVIKTRQVYLSTPWPQLYADTSVRCVRPQTTLRTQNKNAARSWKWFELPNLVDARRWHYAARGGTIVQALLDDLGIRADTIDCSGPPVAKVAREPYILIRPSTVRREWPAAARNPHPGYIDRAARALRYDYRIISVADISPPDEVASEELPFAHERFHRGELHVEQLMGLVAGAAGVIGGVGWLVPAAIAYRTPMFLIFGGWGMHNGPARIFDPRMDTSRIHQALPDRFCLCGSRDHACDKTISRLDEHIESFKERLDADCRAAV